ncbi:MAG: Dam family site-specific DNA-(adenine-N6)-methyltransferase [Dehalococcoidia bacterium]|nr:Dam family site-specific DNA-(adenine-N6)-methyltransferase [Dehalococcoidia bacterium]
MTLSLPLGIVELPNLRLDGGPRALPDLDLLRIDPARRPRGVVTVHGVEYVSVDERQIWLPHVDEHYRGWPAPSRLAPLVKWAGGKRWILPLIGLGIHHRLCETGGTLYEGCAGGAALSSWLGWAHTVLIDTCMPLTALYAEIILNAARVHEGLMELTTRGGDEAGYYHIRGERPSTRIAFAAWCLYLNRNAFNGLWRENRKRGDFNVPYRHCGRCGHALHYHGARCAFPRKHCPCTAYVLTTYPSVEHLTAWATRGRAWEIRCEDFAPVIARAGAGDVVFVDPPYLDGTKGGYTGYVQGGWTLADQERCATSLHEAADRGATILATDGGSDRSRDLYASHGFDVLPVEARHSVGAKGERRKRKREWLVTNAPQLLGT